RYAMRIKVSTTTDLTADAIHQIGLDEVRRIESEEEAIAKKLGFGSLDVLRKHVRADRKLLATSQKDILDRYQRYIDQMNAKLPGRLGRLRGAKLEVRPTEPFREQKAAGADYDPGTPDGSRPGIIHVNTYQPTSRTTTTMESTAYHEGIPGHH